MERRLITLEELPECTVPAAQYLSEKHQIDIIELWNISTDSSSAFIEVFTDAQTHFEVLMSEMKRLCCEHKAYVTTEIKHLIRKGNRRIKRSRRPPAVLGQHDKVAVTFRLWRAPYTRAIRQWGVGGQSNFHLWADNKGWRMEFDVA